LAAAAVGDGLVTSSSEKYFNVERIDKNIQQPLCNEIVCDSSKKAKQSKWDLVNERTPEESSTSSSIDQETKAKQAAIAAAFKITGPSGLTIAEKRKLLWSKKSNTSNDYTDVVNDYSGDNTIQPSGKGYEKSFDDSARQSKFLRLMGHESKSADTVHTTTTPAVEPTIQPIKDDDRMNAELEKQYREALRRKDGRKTGLGL